MKYNFSKYILEDIIESFIDYRGKTPKKTNDGIPLITAKIVKRGRLNPIQEYISVEDYDTWMTRGIPKKGSIILTTEAPLGEIAQLKTSEKVAFAQRVIVLYGKEEVVDNDFLKYYFQSKTFQHKLVERETGTTVTGIKSKELKKIEIEIPSDIVVQKKIANILNQVDSKIDLNNQMIDTLENMASTLFKRWFVDFEFPDENGNPYKSSGGKMIDSELREIPEGWRIGKLSDYGEVVGGGTPSKKKQEYYDDGNISWITPKDLSELKVTFIEKGKLSITEEGLKKSSAKLVPKGTVLFSSRAPIGYMAIAKNSLTTNQGFKSIVPNEKMSSFFIYLWLKRNLEMIKNLGTGSTFKEVSGGTMKNIDTVIPKSKTVSQFDEVIVPVFKLIEKCESENSNLINTRDTLLPKLLSGEIEF